MRINDYADDLDETDGPLKIFSNRLTNNFKIHV